MMEIHNEFEVPLSPERAWGVLLDIPRIARCMPGAVLTEVSDSRAYKGQVSVKIGPVALIFAGNARFEHVDSEAHAARVRAQGNDTKGRGGASALVSFSLAPSSSGSKVSVATDLNLSGSVAQYGRASGIIQAVATELTTSFANNLRTEILQSTPPGETNGSAEAPTASPADDTTQPRPISGLALLWKSLARAIGLR